MIRLIAAIDRKRGLAKNGHQPWYIPDDSEYFKRKSLLYGGNILMGKKTYDVIGRPLEGRRNIVLTHSSETVEGAEAKRDLGILNTLSDVWVIGGASVFEQTIAQADELYLTHIEADFKCDKFFPDFVHDFRLVNEDDLREQNGFLFRYCVYERLQKQR